MWGGGISRDGASLVPNKPRTGVLVSFPPPAYAGIHPTLYLFGFRANALNSHSPLICLALVRGLVSSASGALQGGLGFHGRNLRPPGASGASEASGSLVCGQDVGFGSGFRVFWPPSITPSLPNPKFQHFPGHLLETAGQRPPRATPRRPTRPRLLAVS